LDPHGMILLSTEFYHPKKKNYVLKTKAKDTARIPKAMIRT